jgi:hypothetical protein
MHDDRFFDRLFRSDRSWPLKVGGAGLFGYLAAAVVDLGNEGRRRAIRLGMLIAMPLFAMAAACILIRADVVRRRLRAGHAVGPITRLLFASGVWSLLIWIIGVMLLGFPLAIWIGGLTAEQPAG